ncbi:MAG: DUF2795 domain-containing protein [Patescibacteria group bacterium]|nr:DUF2795 domain-containing protein [Patescibacteria group bacterium]MDE1941237.1 DUF2795 domain-containing protein [Patescibacteria group bacterium]MDE1966770.1 DUF2795 domain-containing protein [Patescibacteria group bacterium]
MPSVNPVAIQSYLKGISYPASKQDVVDCAKENEAPSEISDLLARIPEKDYATPAELTREIGSIERRDRAKNP